MAEPIFSFDDGRNGRSAPRHHAEGWTYLIQVVERDGPVKIGKATNVADRMRWLQCGNPQHLRFLGAVPEAEIPELILHRVFARSRIRGEWFRPHEAMLQLADAGYRLFPTQFEAKRGAGRQNSPLTALSHILRNTQHGSPETILETLALFQGQRLQPAA